MARWEKYYSKSIGRNNIPFVSEFPVLDLPYCIELPLQTHISEILILFNPFKFNSIHTNNAIFHLSYF